MRNNLPSIVALHYVSNDKTLDGLKPWNISRESFTRLLDYFEQEGYHTITFSDIVNGNRHDKEVMITFDDCPKLLWEFAIPELLKRNMKAVFYALAGHFDGYNYWNTKYGMPRIELMSKEEVARIKEVGMEVGSHCYDHIKPEKLTEEDARNSLVSSKKIIEEVIGEPILSVSYPYGSLPVNHKSLVTEAGYKFGVSVSTPWQSKYAYRRWVYTDEDAVDSIRNKMSVKYSLYRAFNDKWTVWSYAVLRACYKQYEKIKPILGRK